MWLMTLSSRCEKKKSRETVSHLGNFKRFPLWTCENKMSGGSRTVKCRICRLANWRSQLNLWTIMKLTHESSYTRGISHFNLNSKHHEKYEYEFALNCFQFIFMSMLPTFCNTEKFIGLTKWTKSVTCELQANAFDFFSFRTCSICLIGREHIQ